MRLHHPRITKFRASALVVILFSSVVITATSASANEKTAARFVPADAEGFVSVALDPSISQKAKLLALSTRLPDSAKKLTTPKADGKAPVDDAIAIDTINFNTDIKPWLGGEIAGALLRPYDNSTSPLPVAYIKVKDQAKAQAFFDKQQVAKTSYRFVNDYAVIVDQADVTDHQAGKGLDAIAALATGSAGLENAPRFKAAQKTLHNDQLAFGWFDLPAIVETTKIAESLSTDEDSEAADQFLTMVKETGAISFEFYATTSSVDMRVVTEKRSAQASETTDSKLLRALPANTLAAFDVPKIDESIKSIVSELDTINTETADATGTVAKGENDFGLEADFDKQTKALLESLTGEGVIAVGSAGDLDNVPFGAVTATKNGAASQKALDDFVNAINYDPKIKIVKYSLPDGTGYTFEYPNAASEFSDVGTMISTDQPGTSVGTSAMSAAFTSAPTARYSANETLPGDDLASAGTTKVSMGVSNGRFILSSDADYLRQIADSQAAALGSTENYTTLFGSKATELNGGTVFVDLAGLVGLAEKAASEGEISPDLKEWLDHLSLFGVRSFSDANHDYVEAKLVFK